MERTHTVVVFAKHTRNLGEVQSPIENARQTRRIDPEANFWSHSAIEHIGDLQPRMLAMDSLHPGSSLKINDARNGLKETT